MAQRKLQQEIDKTFKKVAEGRQAFEAIYDKIQQTSNSSQKEKLEDNLKREIKKLQRHRDQIKTWAAGNEIKDKKPLMEQRKLIESEMEKFKAVEKEMKTKAFSKEGLSAAAKLDPKEREKLDGCQFLSDMVDELERQVETLEAEEESLQATVKKGKKDTGKADRLSEISRLTETHKWHQGKLELLLRALENGNVELEDLNDVKESIKYYVEENQSVEFVDDDTLYDEFNLDADESAWGINNDVERVSSHDAQSTQEEAIEISDSKVTVATGKQKASSADPPATTTRRSSNNLKSPLPALATLHTPHAITASVATSSSMKPAPLPTRPPGETLKYASAAAAAAASDKAGIAPLPPPPGATSSLAPLPPPPSKASATTSPNTMPAVPASKTTTSQKSPQPTPAESIPNQRSPTLSHGATSSVPPTPALEKVETASSKHKTSQAPTSIQEAKESTPEPEQPQTPPPGFENSRPLNGDPVIGEDEDSIYHLPPGLQDLMQSFEITKSRATAGPTPADHRMLELSQQFCPVPVDLDRPIAYKPQDKINVPSWYPQEPLPIMNDPNLYSRIDTDTLFFIFYYRQGTYQQYMAAKALKSQSWRFHKQYQTWFQRHEEPKTITEDFEQGTYRFFDYESTWMNRRKADFRFAYKFLEDDL